MGAGLFSSEELRIVRSREDLHVTNGHWFKPLTCCAEGAALPAFEQAFDAAMAGSSLRFIGRLETGLRPLAVWQGVAEPPFTVLIDWRYHEGLGLGSLNLRTSGPEALVLAFEDGRVAAGVMPFKAGETEALLIEADALLAKLESEEAKDA